MVTRTTPPGESLPGNVHIRCVGANGARSHTGLRRQGGISFGDSVQEGSGVSVFATRIAASEDATDRRLD